MKNTKFIALIFSAIVFMPAAAVYGATVDGIAGFATQNGGTTGGAGGAEVIVSTLAEFSSYATDNTARIIKVTGEINSGDDKGASVRLGNNKTILGCGAGAFFNGVGFFISSKSNIIIRNCRFTMISITNTTDPAVYSPIGDEGRPQILTNGGDCIGIQGTSNNIWIDHCEFYEIDPAVQTNQDLYDGLVDIKNGSAYITVSWNYFHDHHKTNLIGSSDTDNFDRKITFHHNYYRNIEQRTPSYRFGTGHVFNNFYQDGTSSGINSRMGVCLRIERNYFENCSNPIVSESSSSVGYWDLHDSVSCADNSNIYMGCSGSQPTASNCAFTPPYTYTDFLDAAADVKTIAMANAGVGKINTGCGVQPTASATASVSPQNTNTRTPTRTPTRTATPLFTMTHTVIITLTFTASSTRTNTPVSLTMTYTLSVTRTFTPVPPTSTISAVPTATFTGTASRTNTPADTIKFTATSTMTRTAVNTKTFTATATMDTTPASTMTNTTVFSATYTPVITETPTVAATQSSTAIIFPSPTFTASVLPSPSMTATASLTISPTFTLTRNPLPSFTPTATATSSQTIIPLSPTPTGKPALDTGLFTLDIVLFPNPYNPAKGDLKIKFSASSQVKDLSVKIYTVAYRKVLSETGITTADVIYVPQRKMENFSQGIYYLVVSCEDGRGNRKSSQLKEIIILK